MPIGIKGFQKGHKHSDETKARIGLANSKQIKFVCDYCKKINLSSPSHYKKKKRHFCSTKCYSDFRKEFLPKEEHNCYGKGEPIEIKIKKLKCRSIFNHYLRDKKIKRKPCIVCGNTKSEGHHDNYDKPKKVKWFCFKHHREYHRRKDANTKS